MNENLKNNQIPQINIKDSNQLELDLDFEKEQAEIAEKYKVLNLEGLKKINKKWFLDGIPVEKLEEIFEEDHTGGKY